LDRSDRRELPAPWSYRTEDSPMLDLIPYIRITNRTDSGRIFA